MYVLKDKVTTTEVWYVLYMRWCIKWIYIYIDIDDKITDREPEVCIVQ